MTSEPPGVSARAAAARTSSFMSGPISCTTRKVVMTSYRSTSVSPSGPSNRASQRSAKPRFAIRAAASCDGSRLDIGAIDPAGREPIGKLHDGPTGPTPEIENTRAGRQALTERRQPRQYDVDEDPRQRAEAVADLVDELVAVVLIGEDAAASEAVGHLRVVLASRAAGGPSRRDPDRTASRDRPGSHPCAGPSASRGRRAR